MLTKGKTYNRTATPRQIRAIQNYMDNHGNMQKAMLDAGYSPATAKNPANLTRGSTFKRVVEESFPDEALLTMSVVDLSLIGRSSAPRYGERLRYIELIYKLKERIEKRSRAAPMQSLSDIVDRVQKERAAARA